MKKTIIVITMLITMILASNASNKTTVAADIELDSSEVLVLEGRENQPEMPVLEKERNQVLTVSESYESQLNNLLQDEILEIQAICSKTQVNIANYRQSGGKYYTEYDELAKAELSTGSSLDNLMNKFGYSTYQISYYYKPSRNYDFYAGPVCIEFTANGNVHEVIYCCEHGNCQIKGNGWREINYEDPELADLVWDMIDEGTLLLRAYGNHYNSPGSQIIAPTDLTEDTDKFVGNYAIAEDAERRMMNPEWGGVFDITKIENGKIYGTYNRYSSAISANGIALDFSKGVPFNNNRFTAEGTYTRTSFSEVEILVIDEYPCKVDCWFEVINGKIILRTWDLGAVGLGAANIYYKTESE